MFGKNARTIAALEFTIRLQDDKLASLSKRVYQEIEIRKRMDKEIGAILDYLELETAKVPAHMVCKERDK